MKVRLIIITVLLVFVNLPLTYAIDAVEFVKKLEGSNKKNGYHVPYRCSAHTYTIGYGETSPAIVAKGKLTEAEATKLVVDRVKDIRLFLAKRVTADISENQRVVLISLVYNIGKTKFLKSGILRAVNQGDQLKVANEIKRWKYTRKQQLTGLRNRRAIEVKLWLAG